MRHIRNFRNFSINEMQDWAMMPVDVNKGLGDMLNKFYSKFPNLISGIKDFLGNKFSEFSTLLTKVSLEIKKLSSEELSIIGNNLNKFVGNSDLRSKVEEVVKQEFNKSGIIKENKSTFNQVIKNIIMRIFPDLTDVASTLIITGICVLLPSTIVLTLAVSSAALAGLTAIIMGIITGIFVLGGLAMRFFVKDEY